MSSLWSISPYLHHAASLRSDGKTDLAGQALAINHAALAVEAFGGIPAKDTVARAAYDTVLGALTYYSAVFAAEPDLLDQSVRNLRSESFGASRYRIKSDDQPAAVLAILDENLPLNALKYRNRLASIWLQQGAAAPNKERQWVPFGYELCHRLLKGLGKWAKKRGADPRRFTGEKTMRGRRKARLRLRLLERFTHGSAVLSQALDEVDDRIPLVLVGLPPSAVRDTSGRLLPYFIITGLLYSMAVTRKLSQTLPDQDGYAKPALPLVVNLSFGVVAGAKDGSGTLQRVFDAICDPALDIPGLGPVNMLVPMGNSRQWQCQAIVEAADGPQELGLLVLPDDQTPTYVEIRHSGADAADIELARPGSSEWNRVPPPGLRDVTKMPGSNNVQVYQDTETKADGGERSLRILAFAPTANKDPYRGPHVPAGRWRLRISPGSSAVSLAVQRDDSLFGLASGGRQARFTHPDYRVYGDDGRIIHYDDPENPGLIRRNQTANVYASAKNVWRVGGTYQSGAETGNRDTLVPYSGLAIDADGQPDAGDLFAPCEENRSRSGVLVESAAGSFKLRANGTSMAAPVVAARMALGMAEGKRSKGALRAFIQNRSGERAVQNPKGAHRF